MLSLRHKVNLAATPLLRSKHGWLPKERAGWVSSLQLNSLSDAHVSLTLYLAGTAPVAWGLCAGQQGDTGRNKHVTRYGQDCCEGPFCFCTLTWIPILLEISIFRPNCIWNDTGEDSTHVRNTKALGCFGNGDPSWWVRTAQSSCVCLVAALRWAPRAPPCTAQPSGSGSPRMRPTVNRSVRSQRGPYSFGREVTNTQKGETFPDLNELRLPTKTRNRG